MELRLIMNPSNHAKFILDPCCGSRMMWFDRENADVFFGDIRRENLTVTDRTHGNESGTRTISIDPDMEMDFRSLPFPDESFYLVAFDPPHLVRAGKKSWLAGKYGVLSDDWRADIKAGFGECFRVLKTNGVLIFKWNETQIKLSEILKLTDHKPLFGHKTGKAANTHWCTFLKFAK